jgi:hypothetical protein
MSKVSVSQHLAIRVVPVNRPLEFNSYGEQLGYYHCFITHDDPEREGRFAMAEGEWFRGLAVTVTAYGHSGTAHSAIAMALVDYEKKFGPLCVTNHTELDSVPDYG